MLPHRNPQWWGWDETIMAVLLLAAALLTYVLVK